MIKECPVIINNDSVTVAVYDDIKIQFPSIHRDAKTVFISYENDRYKIVDNPAKEPKPATPVAKPKKKTTKSVKKTEKSEIGD